MCDGCQEVCELDGDATIDHVEETIASYLDQLDDPGEVDAHDLAENIVIRMRGKRS
ncbi:hypothetical protein [Streptomyces griseoaurantiacus]|uniref:hypothetical protein n=1 Tax=Streptomyces griseoaurantiacus TaxID=68213 RepID=UPI0030DE0C94